jgi:two-component system, response regulator PdtaR
MTADPNPPPVVLVVEDEELLRLYAENLLEEAGFEVVEAADADTALEILARRTDVRVLFTDIHLGGKLDGMELARKVHDQWPHVLLLITSGATKPPKTEIAEHGHFLPKPYRRDDVIREIDSLSREVEARAQQQLGGR